VKISILSPNLSSNGLGRAYILARVLQRRHEVEVIGPAFSNGIWPPVAAEPVAFRSVPMGRSPSELLAFRRLADLVDGDVIYASKPLLTSFGIGLVKRITAGRPLVVDVDDWEAGFTRQIWRSGTALEKLRYLVSSSLRPHMAHSVWNGPLCERLVRFADAVTVSNRFLQARFGGRIVRHGRDTDALRPDRFDGPELRRRLGLAADGRLVLYFGTIQPYKGVADLVRAVARIDDPSTMLVVVGGSGDEHGRRVHSLGTELLGDRFIWRGSQPFRAVPEFLAAADVAVVPQRRGPATRGQLPAKLFDAMAMARPIVSTAVGDIPEILDGCGWVVPPGSPEALADAITDLFRRPREAAARARRARERCEREYSWNAMESTLAELFRPFERGRVGSA